MNKTKFMFNIVLMCAILIILQACVDQNSSTTKPTSSAVGLTPSPTVEYNSKSKTYWYADPHGIITVEPDGSIVYSEAIQTNDLQRLQLSVPFTILLPSYLPVDVDTSQKPELAMIPDSHSPNSINIQIIYQQMNSTVDRLIKIEETNSLIIWPPTEDMEFTYLDYSGVTVLEQKYTNSLAGQLVTALNYSWNQNGISISVNTLAFEQDEARKIVKSMIH